MAARGSVGTTFPATNLSQSGELEFEDVTERAAVAATTPMVWVALARDYNSDGLMDIYVTGLNRNILIETR